MNVAIVWRFAQKSFPENETGIKFVKIDATLRR